MSRVLISIDQIGKLDHQTSELLNVIDVMQRQGWHVDINTTFVKKSAAPALFALQTRAAVTLLTEKSGELADHYDLIWIYDGFFSQKLIAKISEKDLVSQVVFRHFYDHADVFIPYGPALENRLASASLSLSPFASRMLSEIGIASEKLVAFPWTLGEQFAPSFASPERNGVKKILYISDSLSSEMQLVQQHIADNGVVFDWFDETSVKEATDPAFFQRYDVVIASGFYAAQVIASATPLFLSAQDYVEGYLTVDNAEENLHNHFCCINASRKYTPEEWYTLLIQGFDDALVWVREHGDTLRQQWLLSSLLPRLLSSLPSPHMIVLSEKEIRDLTLHVKALIADKGSEYTFQRWLNDRKLSEARLQALKAFSQAVPGSTDIGVVIIGDDPAAVALSINSVLSQSEAAKSITILTTNPHICHADAQVHLCFSGWVATFNMLLEQCYQHALVLLPAGIRLLEDALILLVEQQIRHADQKVWYADEMRFDEYDEHDIVLRPACNVDLARSFPYMGRVMMFQREFLQAIGGLDPAFTQLTVYDAMFRCLENFGPIAVGRVSEVICITADTAMEWLKNEAVQAEYPHIVSAHLARMGLDAVVEKTPELPVQRVRYNWAVQPLVSIIIPTRDHYVLLKNCIETLMEKTLWARYELLIVDNGSVCEETTKFLEQLAGLKLSNLSVLRYLEPFNFAAINNFAVQHARGDVLLFLNNDVTITQGDWLHAMMEQAMRPEVGMVGARLEYKDGRVQHAGFTVGVRFGVEPSFENEPANEKGYLYYLQAARNVTAVSAACMMIRKEVFIEANGFSEERFPLYFGDVDLGMKLQQQGYLNVWTPYARVTHMGGASRLMQEKFHVPARPDADVYAALRSKWGTVLSQDIAYHPAMEKLGKLFTLSESTARFREPLPGRPLPVVLANHVNWFGCGNHRVIQPFKAMEENLFLEGGLTYGTSGLMEVAQLQPDVILMELITASAYPAIISQYRQVCDAKIVAEYDDYLLNLPIKNSNRALFPQSIVKDFRRVMETVDWVVVATPALKEAYKNFHSDIRVAPNRLATRQWGHLQSARGRGEKIRVGWAGGGTHAGDLEILRPIIKELEDEVEWVFMGMKPANIRCEFHPGVPFEMYPEKLASLDLDLALVPLEINQFNECKSNLRLLEIGTCGVPIIATNIEPYRCDLPVTLVENRFKDWMNAIKAYVYDDNLRASKGDQLRTEIHQTWYLREQGLDDWRNAWLPGEK